MMNTGLSATCDRRTPPGPPYIPKYMTRPSINGGGGSACQQVIFNTSNGGIANYSHYFYDGHSVVPNTFTSGITINCNNAQFDCNALNQGFGDNTTVGALTVETDATVYINNFWYSNPTPSPGGDWIADGLIRDNGNALNLVIRGLYAKGAQAILTSTQLTGTIDIQYFLIEDLRGPLDDGREHGIYIGGNDTLIATDGCIRGRTFPISESPSSDFTVNELGDMLKSRCKTTTLTRVHCIAENGNVGRPFDFTNGGVVTMTECYGAMGPNSNNASMISYGEEQIDNTDPNYLNDGRTHELHIHNCVFDLHPQKTGFTQGRFLFAPTMFGSPTVTYDITGNIIFNIDISDTNWGGSISTATLIANNTCIDLNGNKL